MLDGDNELTDAVIASGHGFTIEGFAITNYTSNGITVQGATKVAFKDSTSPTPASTGSIPSSARTCS